MEHTSFVRRYGVWGIIVLGVFALGLLLYRQAASQAAGVVVSSEGTKALDLTGFTITSVTSSYTTGNYDGGGITLHTGNYDTNLVSFGTALDGLYHDTACFFISSSNVVTWSSGATAVQGGYQCKGNAAIGSYYDLSGWTVNITGYRAGQTPVTLTVKNTTDPPAWTFADTGARWRIRGGIRLYLDESGGTYHCRSDHWYADRLQSDHYTNSSPAGCDLTLSQALVSAHRDIAGSGGTLTPLAYGASLTFANWPNSTNVSADISGTLTIAAGARFGTVLVLKNTGDGQDTYTLTHTTNNSYVTDCKFTDPANGATTNPVTLAAGESKNISFGCSVASVSPGDSLSFTMSATSQATGGSVGALAQAINTKAPITCNDPDNENYDNVNATTGAVVPSVKGTTTNNTSSFIDSCKSSYEVTEYYCDASGGIPSFSKPCTYGCSDGKCRTKAEYDSLSVQKCGTTFACANNVLYGKAFYDVSSDACKVNTTTDTVVKTCSSTETCNATTGKCDAKPVTTYGATLKFTSQPDATSIDSGTIKIESGATYMVPFTFKNTGNAQDTYILSTTIPASVIAGCGWYDSAVPNTRLDGNQITAAAGNEKNLQFKCSVENADPKSVKLSFSVKPYSLGGKLTVDAERTFSVTTSATATKPADDGTTIPADWREIVWNDLGLKSYVSVNTPQSIIDAAKTACATTKPENVKWPNPSDFTKPDTVGVPSCNGTVTPPPPPTPISKECKAGEVCSGDSWCPTSSGSSGWYDKCFYPDGKFTCNFNASSTNSCGPSQMKACPAGTSHCSSNDSNCIDVGQTGTSSGWCYSGQKCSFDNGTATCVSWGESCPAGAKLCDTNDANCVEPGKTGPATGWCASGADNCYSDDGQNLFCQKMEQQTYSCDSVANRENVCPSGYSHCKKDDSKCTDIGQTNAIVGAWCTRGKQCNTTNGVTCVQWNQECPAGSTRCSAGDTNCHEPETYFTYKDNEWPYCPDAMTLYSQTENKAYCLSVKSSDWTNKDFVPKVPAGYGFCRSSDSRCLEPGETGPGDAWCGWMPPMSGGMGYDQNAKSRTCPKLGETTVPVEPPKPPVECTVKLKQAVYYVNDKNVCAETFDGCLKNTFATKTACEDSLNTVKDDKPAALACIANVGRMVTKIVNTLGIPVMDNQSEALSISPLAVNDFKILEDARTVMNKSLLEWKKLGESGGWSKVNTDCSTKAFQWELSLDPVFKRLGGAQVDQFILDRINATRDRMDRLLEKKDLLSDEALDVIDVIQELLDDAEDYYEDGKYDFAKNVLKKVSYYKGLLGTLIDDFDTSFEDRLIETISKHIEEKVLRVVETKFANLEAVMTELIEKNMQSLLNNVAAIGEKIQEVTLNAVTKAVEHATYITEERVKEKFLKRIDDLTATVKALEEELAAQTVLKTKVAELNNLLLSNAWSADTAQELQEDIAAVLAAKAAGESNVQLLAKMELIVAKAKAKLENEPTFLVAAGEQGFVDAPATRWDGGLMLAAKNACIASGRGDDPTRLDATRNSLYQETVALTIRSAGIPLVNKELKAPVSGLPSDAWSVPYFRTLQDTGYTVNVPYNADTTRGEAAKLMYSLMKDKLPAAPSAEEASKAASAYKDYAAFSADKDTIRAVAAMANNGLMQGYGKDSPKAGYFGYDEPMTRNMLITVMVRAADLMDVDPCETTR